MNEFGNQHTPKGPQENYSYDQYDRSVHNRRKPGFVEAVLGPSLYSKIKSPLFATGFLIVAGGLFAWIIMASYPDDMEGADGQAPIISAQLDENYKVQPDGIDGVDVPYRDSTVFNATRDGEGRSARPIENLLEPVEPEEEPAFDELRSAEAQAEPSDRELKTPEEPVEKEVVASADEKSERPEALHPAGSSPETIEFVRSVLEKEESPQKPEAIEPAAGNAKAGASSSQTAQSGTPKTVAPGDYYVQLGSVRSESGAADEWSKLNKAFSELGDLKYRVEKADLGDRGTFYRIQAGPMSKASAGDICDSIKSKKPGGCLVVR